VLLLTERSSADKKSAGESMPGSGGAGSAAKS